MRSTTSTLSAAVSLDDTCFLPKGTALYRAESATCKENRLANTTQEDVFVGTLVHRYAFRVYGMHAGNVKCFERRTALRGQS